jgi:ketosteroid isomerase-like protein
MVTQEVSARRTTDAGCVTAMLATQRFDRPVLRISAPAAACAAMSDKAANEAIINCFYQAFQKRDAAGMNACYAPDISFRDPVFGPLQGDRARAMWSMLTANPGSTLTVAYQVVEVGDSAGAATWQAQYNFPSTGRGVHNHITSRFWFEDGLIKRQEDTFNLWKWASMALGPRGQLLGWLPQCRTRFASRRRQALRTTSSRTREPSGSSRSQREGPARLAWSPGEIRAADISAGNFDTGVMSRWQPLRSAPGLNRGRARHDAARRRQHSPRQQ